MKNLQIKTNPHEFIDMKQTNVQTSTNLQAQAQGNRGLIGPGQIKVVSSQSTKAAAKTPLITTQLQADLNNSVRATNQSNTSGLGRRMRKGESESRKSLKHLKPAIFSTADNANAKDAPVGNQQQIANRSQRTQVAVERRRFSND
jgi:hypothetical protein